MRKRKGLSIIHDTFASTLIFRLYNTNILIDNGHEIILDSGGWETNHTKNCMNDNLPDGWSVFQKNFNWFIKTNSGIIEFNDKMVINKITGLQI